MEKQKIYCPTCFLEWNTRSKRKYITCPNCLIKVENKSYIQKEQKA